MSQIRTNKTTILLDNSLEQGGRSLLFRDPHDIIAANEASEVGAALLRVETAVNAGFHAVGFLAYELGYALEPRLASLMPEQRPMPLLWFAIFHRPQVLSGADVPAWLEAEIETGHRIDALAPSIARDAYLEKFNRIRELIHAGDLYQMNFTFKSRFSLSGNPLSLYAALRSRQRVAHGAVILTEQFSILSASPEQFINVNHGVIETRPMKGTAARAPLGRDDAAIREWLTGDEKSRAENLMIVDLMRNDLGRIAKMGSVNVTELFKVETYETLHQMISCIRANLRHGIRIETLVRALFPPGSVTGAPKIRAMELIREMETEPRGVYTGAIGMFAPGGDAAFNVAIRTVVIDRNGNGEIGIGSGLVADSTGTDEYEECLLKMKFFRDCCDDFQLIESLRFERDVGYWLITEHMARLEQSARKLGFAFNTDKVFRALNDIITSRAEPMLRVRLLLSRDGSIECTAVAMLLPNPQIAMRYVISDKRVLSTDPLITHKTTRRELYDGEHDRLSRALGIDEVLFLNERGELTEGSRTNIFVERQQRLVTPPLSAGLLPGTLRARLIADGRAVEARLMAEDLVDADEVWLGNSVRGLIRAVKVGSGKGP